MPKNIRADHVGTHRRQFEINKKKIFATQDVCAICGRPVDFSLKFPHPLSATVDHIVPIDKGGHPSDLANLQLAHFCCNRQKSNKMPTLGTSADGTSGSGSSAKEITNNDLPLTVDWQVW